MGKKKTEEEVVPEITDAQKKRVQAITGAGRSNEILGWFILASSAWDIWLFSFTHRKALTIWILTVVIAVYFLRTGKYIRYGSGRGIGKLLFANGILSLVLTIGIVPLINSILSFKGSLDYRRLTRELQPVYAKSTLQINTKEKRWFVIILALSLISLAFRLHTNHYTFNATIGQSAASQTSTYTSVTDQFTVEYPGTPSVTPSTSSVQGHNVPYNTYISTINNDNQEYYIYAYNWPAQYFNWPKVAAAAKAGAMQSSVEAIIKAVKGTSTGAGLTRFSGQDAYNESFYLQSNGRQFDGYVTLFFDGNREYALLSLGASKADFTTFLNSFQYTGK